MEPRSMTFILAVADDTRHYTTPEAVKDLYRRLAPVSPKGLEVGHSGRGIATVQNARLVEHENGCFIEMDVVVYDELTLQLPSVYIEQRLRASLLDTKVTA